VQIGLYEEKRAQEKGIPTPKALVFQKGTQECQQVQSLLAHDIQWLQQHFLGAQT